ncbi:DSD1 family PLP-dependent enzyme [Rhodopseudomonas sp. HC1]|uniref:DSD1 family PLP-dependent enzyme n=1 Tax=Rhodopseudomonas infernalis TaxID=2897386 RepID=UPI001EE79D36|nr:DSD1 family PLP-dependent enzyme [Rhodopseudomonas infernalis]MCG6204229.1 DSD1 family PLP-dependent enzyme [Rhodopseudomonas infernalis]
MAGIRDAAGFSAIVCEVLRHVPTPALVVDSDALQANIDAMAAQARDAGVLLRPHAKTHKTVEIARRQLAAGARGIACATPLEILAMANGGVQDLLLTSPMQDVAKTSALIAAARLAKLSVVVDHPSQIELLREQMQAGGRPLTILIDVDVGQRRTGVCSATDSVALARLIGDWPDAVFGGLQGFAGQVQHVLDPAERKSGNAAVAATLCDHAQALGEAGFACADVTGSGTGTFEFDIAGPFTELQVGSYIFMDADYGRVQNHDGQALPFRRTLYVLATVTSVNRAGELTVDAGVKALALNGPLPDVFGGLPEGSSYRFAGDEHGVISLPAGTAPPQPGQRVLIGATHCDPTVNLFSRLHAVSADGATEEWAVRARY